MTLEIKATHLSWEHSGSIPVMGLGHVGLEQRTGLMPSYASEDKLRCE